MRTKLILGLTAGLMAVTQIGSAQEVSSELAGDSILNVAAPDTTTSVALMSDSLAANPGSAIDLSSPINPLASKDSSDVMAGSVGWNFTDDTALQTSTDVQSAPKSLVAESRVAKRQATQDTDFTGSSVDWLNVGATGTEGMTATTHESPLSSQSAGSEYAMNPAMDNNADGLLRAQDRAGASGGTKGGGRMPLLASPEPGTVSLLILGGATVVGAMRRRKQAL